VDCDVPLKNRIPEDGEDIDEEDCKQGGTPAGIIDSCITSEHHCRYTTTERMKCQIIHVN